MRLLEIENHKDSHGHTGRDDFAHARPDFLRPPPGFGENNLGRFASGNAGRENAPSRDFGDLSGFPCNQSAMDGFEGQEFCSFDLGPWPFSFPSDPAGSSFPDNWFPQSPGYFQRCELEGLEFL